MNKNVMMAGALALFGASIGVVETCRAAGEVKGVPFSWDRVPVYAHLGKTADDFTAQELEFLARNFDFVSTEKSQAVRKRGNAEAGIYEVARELKKLNPRMTVIFYWNTFLDIPHYAAAKCVKPEWHLKTAADKPLMVRKTLHTYDMTVPEMRGWWSDVAAQAMREAPLGGIFADALPQVLHSGKENVLGAEKHQALVAGLKQMMDETRRKLGPDKIILANGTRGTEFRVLLDWDSLSGVMIEHFAHFGTADKEAIAADIETIGLAGRKGKIVVVKGWPGFDFTDEEQMKRPYEELAKLAAERLTFPLACFLVAAQPKSYFCYTWGYTETKGTFARYPEFSRRLGPPRGEAKRDGWKYEREFECASVRVDLEQKTARIDWR